MSDWIWLWKGIFHPDTPSCVSTTCYILITWEEKGNSRVWSSREAGAIILINTDLLSKREKNGIIGFGYTFHFTQLMNVLCVRAASTSVPGPLHLGAWKRVPYWECHAPISERFDSRGHLPSISSYSSTWKVAPMSFFKASWKLRRNKRRKMILFQEESWDMALQCPV